jgi:hypothetical protein
MSAFVANEFSLCRLRFSFRAEGPVHFAKMAANTLRGAFGYALREAAGDEFKAIFAPGGAADAHPSGLADLPRPFVFRSSHLDGVTIEPGQSFSFDVHLFETRRPLAEIFTAAFRMMAWRGIGAGSSRLELLEAGQVDVVLPLSPCPAPVEAVTVDFLTPTELKWREQVASEPQFPVLFARVRDRIATLRRLYGGGAPDIDFRALGERAAAVRMTASEIRFLEATRRSSRTGQRHPIGGFAGWASYEGPLAEFLPWLQAAAFTGVGRQTTWGKGELRVRVGKHSP